MKLPSDIKVGVQSLGRKDPGAHLAAGRSVASAIENVGSAATAAIADYSRKKTESQEREARLAMSESMASFEGKYGGKDYIPTSDIPMDIKIRRTEKVTGADGVVSEVMREQIPAYEVYPELYKKFAESNITSAASVIDDDEYRSNWASEASVRSNTGYSSRMVTANARQEEFLNKQLATQISDAVSNQDFDGAKILAEDIADDNARAAAVRNIDTAKETSYVDSLLLGGADTDAQLLAIEAEAVRLRDLEQDSNLSTRERLAAADSLDAASSEHEMSLVERRKREDSQIISDVWMSIDNADPRTNDATAQRLFEDGLISGGEMTSMKRSIAANRKAAVRAQATNIDLDVIAVSSYGIDPKDKEARKQVNARYESYTKDTGDSAGSAVKIMQEFKVVPDALMGRFRSANRADANGLRETAELWNKAEDYAPQSLSDLKDNEVDVVRKVAANMRLGLSAGDSVEQVRRYEAMTPQQTAALKEQAKTIGENNTAALADMANAHEGFKLPWGWVPFKQGTPDVPAFMASEFSATVDKYMPQVGYQLGVAQRMAFTDIAKNWQKTDVNGDWKLMKNAPQGPTEQIRSLISSQYGEEKDIVVLSDQLTQLQLNNGKPVSYQAFKVIDPDTQEIEILPRFQWDATAAAEARRDQLLTEAQTKRAQRTKVVGSNNWQGIER